VVSDQWSAACTGGSLEAAKIEADVETDGEAAVMCARVMCAPPSERGIERVSLSVTATRRYSVWLRDHSHNARSMVRSGVGAGSSLCGVTMLLSARRLQKARYSS
jgi:hypothetical protein